MFLASGFPRRPIPAPPTATWLRAWIAGEWRTLKKRVNRLRPNHRNSAAYHAHRFPDVSEAQLNERIARFGAQLGRFGGVKAEKISAYVFRVHDPEAASRVASTGSVGGARSGPLAAESRS